MCGASTAPPSARTRPLRARGENTAARRRVGESKYVEPVLRAVRIHAQTPGRPRSRPQQLAADKGYDVPRVRTLLRARGIRAVIPVKRRARRWGPARGRPITYDRATYRRRNVIERTVGALKEARAVATRYEKLAVQYLAQVQFSMIRFLVKHLDQPLSHTA